MKSSVENVPADKDRIAQLRKMLNYHSNLYYVMDTSEISDYEYDTLMNELKDLEKRYPEEVTPDSPTMRIGGKAVSPGNCFLIVSRRLITSFPGSIIS